MIPVHIWLAIGLLSAWHLAEHPRPSTIMMYRESPRGPIAMGIALFVAVVLTAITWPFYWLIRMGGK